jgi:thioredoxin-related protein
MHKILFLTFVTLTTLFAKVDFVKDYQTAVKIAKEDSKNILVMLTSQECPSCWWMKNIAFKDEELSERMKEHYVAVEVDVDRDTIPLNLSYIGTPTFYLLDKNEDQLSRMDGRVKAKKFKQRLDLFID